VASGGNRGTGTARTGKRACAYVQKLAYYNEDEDHVDDEEDEDN